LAETYVALIGQIIEGVRRAMLACLTNGTDPNPIRRSLVGREPPSKRSQGCGIGDPNSGVAQRATEEDGGDCGGDGCEDVDDFGAVAAPAPARSGRPSGRRRLGRDRLTPEEVADLMAPPVPSYPRWVKPLTSDGMCRVETGLARFG
jgi:hypothetical protein